MFQRWPLRTRLWFFFGLAVLLGLGGTAALLEGEGKAAVLVYIVAGALIIRGFIDLARSRRNRSTAPVEPPAS